MLVIDVQDKLLPSIRGREALLDAALRLVRGAALFGVPALATEQYPQGIGPTAAGLAAALGAAGAKVLHKMTFSCVAEETVAAALDDLRRTSIVLAGIEAHVCVLQTALDLKERGYGVRVCADAVGSRSDVDYFIALERLRHAGVGVSTVESELFEMCHACGTSEFKSMIELIKPPRPADPRWAR